MTINGVSSVELMKSVIEADQDLAAVAPGGVTVGPATMENMRKGCIVVNEAGIGSAENYLPLMRPRMAITVHAPSVAKAEEIAGHMYDELHTNGAKRRIVRQPSNSKSYLIHWTMVNGGPNAQQSSNEDIWQDVMIVTALISTEEGA